MLQYKVLIIGCGNIAGKFDEDKTQINGFLPLTHAGAFQKHGGFNILGCYDSDIERAKEFKRKWSVLYQFNSPDELMQSSAQFDVVSICSPTAFHEEHLLLAKQLKPTLIFCEKPISTSSNSACNIIDEIKLAGIKIAVNYNRRWDTKVRELRKQIDSGKWGHIRSVACFYNKGINNNGGHLIDLLIYLFGDLELIATGKPIFDFWNDDPTIPALLFDANGVSITLNPGYAKDFSIFEIEIISEKGVIRICNGGLQWKYRNVIESETFKGYFTLENDLLVEGEYMSTTLNAITNIYKFLSVGEALLSDDTNALNAQRLCEEIRARALKTFTE